MRIAIVGSRSVTNAEIEAYLEECDEIVSGGACGVDACAAEYARQKGIRLKEFLPDYSRYGRAAPIIRNKKNCRLLRQNPCLLGRHLKRNPVRSPLRRKNRQTMQNCNLP